MITVEIEAPIIDHRLNIFSVQLPAQSRRAKVIVMFDESNSEVPAQGALAHLRAHPAQARGDGLPLKREELYDRASPR